MNTTCVRDDFSCTQIIPPGRKAQYGEIQASSAELAGVHEELISCPPPWITSFNSNHTRKWATPILQARKPILGNQSQQLQKWQNQDSSPGLGLWSPTTLLPGLSQTRTSSTAGEMGSMPWFPGNQQVGWSEGTLTGYCSHCPPLAKSF